MPLAVNKAFLKWFTKLKIEILDFVSFHKMNKTMLVFTNQVHCNGVCGAQSCLVKIPLASSCVLVYRLASRPGNKLSLVLRTIHRRYCFCSLPLKNRGNCT